MATVPGARIVVAAVVLVFSTACAAGSDGARSLPAGPVAATTTSVDTPTEAATPA